MIHSDITIEVIDDLLKDDFSLFQDNFKFVILWISFEYLKM